MKRMHRLILPLLAAVAAPTMVQAAPGAMMPAVATAPVNFKVYLPLRDTAGLDALLAAQQDEGSPSFHKWLTPAQFNDRFGPSADAIAAAKAAIEQAGLSVTNVSGRALSVSGTVASASKLLGTSLGVTADAADRGRMVATGQTVLPSALQALGAKVISFSRIRPAEPFTKVADIRPVPLNRVSGHGPYWYNDMKQAYDYPSYQAKANGKRLDGTGASVAILMSDLLYPGDLDAYFNHEKFSTTTNTANPKLNVVLVNGGGVAGGGGGVEASLDAMMVTGSAPGAKTTLVSLPSLSFDDIIAGYNQIVADNSYDIVTSSFGLCELYLTPGYNGGDKSGLDTIAEMDAAFKQGNAQGITFLASSGDNGGLQCLNKDYFNSNKKPGMYIPGVSLPAASGYVTAVGGGNLVTAFKSGSLDSSYVGENGYGDPLQPEDPYGTGKTVTNAYWGAGGGISEVYRAPDSQKGTNTGSKKFRTLPDIGMQVGGCPRSAIQPCGADRSAVYIYYNGKIGGVIGTSVSSPQFAGALAIYVGQNGRMGDANPYFYKYGKKQTANGGINAPDKMQYYRRSIPGNDGVYTDTQPSVNYNYIYGNGSPDIRKLFGFMKADPAGVPQTASNP